MSLRLRVFAVIFFSNITARFYKVLQKSLQVGRINVVSNLGGAQAWEQNHPNAAPGEFLVSAQGVPDSNRGNPTQRPELGHSVNQTKQPLRRLFFEKTQFPAESTAAIIPQATASPCLTLRQPVAASTA